MKSELEIKFECLKCGGTVIELPDNPTDDSIATCKSCGTVFGTWRDIQAKAREVAIARVSDDFRAGLKKAFRGSKNIKIR